MIERSFPMPSAKHAATVKKVSVRELQSAVKSALEAAKKDHPQVKLESAGVSTDQLPIYLRYPWFCGLPPFPWIDADVAALAAFNARFNANLAASPVISEAAAGGKLQPVLEYSAGSASIGFVPDDISLVP
jgi:hypothetical protein